MKHPNILLLLSDDQGPWALGCAGNSEIITPRLDQLAREGMRFDQFFCVSPVCSPARASLLCGCIPSRHGIHDWLRDDTKEQAQIEYLAGQQTLPSLLARAGYDCALSGKWHLGASHRPQQGFSHWYCHKSGGGPYYGAPMYRNGQLYREPEYITKAITDDALAYLESRKGKAQPFFLQVGYTAPHAPWLENHPKEFTDLYQDCPFQSVPHLPPQPHRIFLTDDALRDERGNLTGYFAAVTAMDWHIGRILDYLDREGMAQDTLVIFTSDNGFCCGHHGLWGKGNGTYPINMYEECVKVPFIARHSGQIPSGSTCSDLQSAYDFLPTVLDYIGLPCPRDDQLPGQSFARALQGLPGPGREDVVVMDEYGPNRMIRTSTHKFIARYPQGPCQLFDLEKDPGEQHNLLEQQPHHPLAAQLLERLEQWFSRYASAGMDGRDLPVYGCGQVGRVDQEGASPAFSLDDYIRKTPQYIKECRLEKQEY